jgi:heptosyltransferase I
MSSLPLTSPPESLCILRLSAIGDISHTLPVVRTLQARWPDTRLTWIIGKTEHALVGDIPGIDFIIFDKKRGWRAYLDVRRQLRGRRFDVLLHMQMALRASLISLFIDAPIKLGFDRARAKDGQWLFTNAQIAPRPREHVLDSLFGFSAALGVTERRLRWDIPIPEAARRYAEQLLPGAQPTLIISPCSSQAHRNWTAEGYAAVADYAVERHGMRVLLTGGGSALEREMGNAIEQLMRHHPLNVIGATNLKQLLALLSRAAALLAPDAGPAHLATAVGTPVIGLYACTNPDRARPYLSEGLVVNKYPESVQVHYGKLPGQLPWGTRVRDRGAMSLIAVTDVTAILDRLLANDPR